MPEDQIFDRDARAEIPVDFSAGGGSAFGGNQPEPAWKKLLKNKKVIISAAVVLVLALGATVYFVFFYKPAEVVSNNVILQIKGPTQITSGNEVEYTVVYRNRENADLKDVSLDLLFPTGFKFKSATPASTSSTGQTYNLPLVKQGKDGQVLLRGKLSGSTGEDKEIKAKLRYQLSNFNSNFEVAQSIHTNILPPDLTLDINGPVDVVAGQDSTFVVTLTNVTAQDFDNLALQMYYPADFIFTSSNPIPAKEHDYWKIEHLPSGSSTNIEITGSFIADAGIDLLTRAELGQIINNVYAPQISSTATFKVIPSSLSLKVTSDPKDYVDLGNIINFKLNYANEGNIGLTNLVITTTLSGPALDLARISAQNGIITGNIVTWKAATFSNLSSLSPHEKGEINFSVPLKSLPTTNLKNQVISASSNIIAQELNKSTRAADINLDLISRLGLDVTGDYVSGTVPMEVGKSTLFEMTFVLTNLSNDLTNVDVAASVPLPSSAWKNVIIPSSESSRLTFDPSAGKIKWHLGNVAAFTGKYIPALKVTFQLEVVPDESDRGKPMPLLANIQATGLDNFVNQQIQSDNITIVDTSSIDDDVLQAKGSSVQ